MVRRLRDRTVAGELPTMQQATQAAFFVPSQRQRYPPVNAELVQHTQIAVGITEHNQVFAQQLSA